MSEMEYHEGTLKELDVDDIEKFCKEEVLNLMGAHFVLPEFIGSFKEYMQEYWGDDYFITNNRVFEISIHKKSTDLDEINDVHYIGNKKYAFRFYFYNGGTCLEEMLGEHFE